MAGDDRVGRGDGNRTRRVRPVGPRSALLILMTAFKRPALPLRVESVMLHRYRRRLHPMDCFRDVNREPPRKGRLVCGRICLQLARA
jgi:hypothetical protein